MDGKVLVCYKSVTGFTKDYARMIATELGGTAMELKAVTAETMSGCDTVIFGGRFHAGRVDGLKRARALLAQGGGKTFVVFATGAMPAAAAEKTLTQAWENNLTAAELDRVPHFYLPGGLRYERMPLGDRLMMKVFAAAMKGQIKRKRERTAEDEEFMRMISTSYDLSSREYIEPLIDAVQRGRPS